MTNQVSIPLLKGCGVTIKQALNNIARFINRQGLKVVHKNVSQGCYKVKRYENKNIKQLLVPYSPPSPHAIFFTTLYTYSTKYLDLKQNNNGLKTCHTPY